MSFAIPAKRLLDNSMLVAFRHPVPSYQTHILILPKRKYRSLTEVPADDTEFMSALLAAVRSLVEELGLEQKGYRLIVNGGPAKDVEILHFHLVSAEMEEIS
ncbi:MAG: HIT domain-containing protein [Anaerolineales bacterium]|jgi:histidine triad (HIT) family protein